MAGTTFAALWESVDYSLHKITCLLKGAVAVGEDAQPINETLSGLVYLALEKVEEAGEQLEALRKQCHELEKGMEEPSAPPTRKEREF